MPLLECPDCGREVSDAAASCPHCGRPIAGKREGQGTSEGQHLKNQFTSAIIGAIGLMLALFFTCSVCSQ